MTLIEQSIKDNAANYSDEVAAMRRDVREFRGTIIAGLSTMTAIIGLVTAVISFAPQIRGEDVIAREELEQMIEVIEKLEAENSILRDRIEVLEGQSQP